jgi:hypothetical protein
MRRCIHRCGGLADLARILERVVSVCEAGLGIAKHPHDEMRSPSKDGGVILQFPLPTNNPPKGRIDCVVHHGRSARA